jgi:hypothetical protein
VAYCVLEIVKRAFNLLANMGIIGFDPAPDSNSRTIFSQVPVPETPVRRGIVGRNTESTTSGEGTKRDCHPRFGIAIRKPGWFSGKSGRFVIAGIWNTTAGSAF